MIFFGRVSAAGILELDHPELYGDLLKGKFANCRVQLDIDRKKTPRSQQQSAYLFAAVYPPIAKHTGYSIPEVHEVCKQMFLPPRQLSIGNQTVTVPGSTALLTTAEMMDYIERCIGLAHELGCVVQTPEEAGFISNTKPPVTAYDDVQGERHVHSQRPPRHVAHTRLLRLTPDSGQPQGV